MFCFCRVLRQHLWYGEIEHCFEDVLNLFATVYGTGSYVSSRNCAYRIMRMVESRPMGLYPPQGISRDHLVSPQTIALMLMMQPQVTPVILLIRCRFITPDLGKILRLTFALYPWARGVCLVVMEKMEQESTIFTRQQGNKIAAYLCLSLHSIRLQIVSSW